MSTAYPVFNLAFIGKEKAYPLQRTKTWNNDPIRYDSILEQVNEVWSLPLRSWGINFRNLLQPHRDKLLELFDACRGTSRPIYLEDNLDYTSECSWTQSAYLIAGLHQTLKYFMITGQHAKKFEEGWKFKVTGSTGNDGIYTISSVSQDATYTYLYVVEDIDDDTVDGDILRMYFLLHKVYYEGEDYSWNEPKKDIKPDYCTITVDDVEQTEDTDYTLTDTDGIIIFDSDHVPADDAVIEASFEFYYRVHFNTDSFGDSNIDWIHYSADTINLIEIKRSSIAI